MISLNNIGELRRMFCISNLYSEYPIAFQADLLYVILYG